MAATVRRLHPDDWQAYRAVRLEALASDPTAFGSTWAREAEFTEEQWRDRLTSAVFAAELAPAADDGGRAADGASAAGSSTEGASTEGAAAGVVGTAGVIADRERAGVLHVVGMWVRPEVRGHGVAGALLGALCDLAGESGAKQLQLWVTESNVSARRLYERWGFAATQEREALVSDPTIPVVEMVRDLDGAR